MLTAKQVAEYSLSKDSERKLFNYNVVSYNGRKFYEGNARINIYLFFSSSCTLSKVQFKAVF